MADTLDWVCYQIGVKRDEITSARRDKALVEKRQIAIEFFRLLKKSTVWIGNVINREHATIFHALRNMPNECHNRAVQLVKKYETDINKRDITELKVETITRKVLKKVPDYKHSRVDTVLVDEIVKQRVTL